MKGFDLEYGVLYPIFVDLEVGDSILLEQFNKIIEDEKAKNYGV